MRTSPAEHTWGTHAAQIVIRQSRPITVDELFEHFDWRGMELLDVYLVPKGAGLSHEEKAHDETLCAATSEKLKPLFADRAGDLRVVSARQHEVGFIVSTLTDCNETVDAMESWFAQGYREIWMFLPWYRQVDIHTAPDNYKHLRVGDILPGFELPVAYIFED